MADYEDTKVKDLIINNMSQEKFDELKAAGELDPTQIYCTPEDGGASGDYLPLSGGTLTGDIAFNAFNKTSSFVPILRQLVTGELAISVKLDSGIYVDICKFNVAGNLVLPGSQYSVLGRQGSYWDNVYTTKLNNGADLAVPTEGGTLARIEDIDTAVGDISTALTAILGE